VRRREERKEVGSLCGEDPVDEVGAGLALESWDQTNRTRLEGDRTAEREPGRKAGHGTRGKRPATRVALRGAGRSFLPRESCR